MRQAQLSGLDDAWGASHPEGDVDSLVEWPAEDHVCFPGIAAPVIIFRGTNQNVSVSIAVDISCTRHAVTCIVPTVLADEAVVCVGPVDDAIHARTAFQDDVHFACPFTSEDAVRLRQRDGVLRAQMPPRKRYDFPCVSSARKNRHGLLRAR